MQKVQPDEETIVATHFLRENGTKQRNTTSRRRRPAGGVTEKTQEGFNS
jgi:hypothetical protein